MSSRTSGAEIWEQVRERLKEQLPRATYDTWVAQADVVSLSDGVLTLGVGNDYARDRLTEIGVLEPVASEVVGSVTRVAVIVPGEAGRHEGPPPAATRDAVTLQPVYRSEYDEVVRPEQAIPLPRYYLRWLPFLGVDLAWIPVAFRQVAFFRGLAFDAGESFQASIREIALWSGMSMRNLQRKVGDPRLRWFVRRVETEPRWRISADGRPHQEALTWQVEASMPLTPSDQASLERFLRQRMNDGLNAAQAVIAALQVPVEELLPWPDVSEVPEMGEPPQSVQDVVKRALGKAAGEVGVQKAVDALAFRIAGYSDPIYIGYHFLRKELPELGPGPGWFVQCLRALGAEQRTHGQVTVKGGYPSIARALGVTTRTAGRWIADANTGESRLSMFVSDVGVVRLAGGSTDLQLVVRQEEVPDVRTGARAEQSGVQGNVADGQGVVLRDPPGGQTVVHRERADGHSVMHSKMADGQSVNHRKVPGGHSVRHSAEADGQSVTHREQRLTDIVSLFKGGGGSLSSQSKNEESSTTINQASLSPHGQIDVHSNGHWEMTRLLDLACVHRANRRVLEQASPAAYVSWLLYWASDLGKRLVDPVGHAISRLKDDPMTPMEGAFGRLAELGPEAVEELMMPLVLGGVVSHSGNRDWDSEMQGASRDRLKKVSELLGFDPKAWVLEDDDDAEEGSGNG